MIRMRAIVVVASLFTTSWPNTSPTSLAFARPIASMSTQAIVPALVLGMIHAYDPSLLTSLWRDVLNHRDVFWVAGAGLVAGVLQKKPYRLGRAGKLVLAGFSLLGMDRLPAQTLVASPAIFSTHEIFADSVQTLKKSDSNKRKLDAPESAAVRMFFNHLLSHPDVLRRDWELWGLAFHWKKFLDLAAREAFEQLVQTNFSDHLGGAWWVEQRDLRLAVVRVSLTTAGSKHGLETIDEVLGGYERLYFSETLPADQQDFVLRRLVGLHIGLFSTRELGLTGLGDDPIGSKRYHKEIAERNRRLAMKMQDSFMRLILEWTAQWRLARSDEKGTVPVSWDAFLEAIEILRTSPQPKDGPSFELTRASGYVISHRDIIIQWVNVLKEMALRQPSAEKRLLGLLRVVREAERLGIEVSRMRWAELNHPGILSALEKQLPALQWPSQAIDSLVIHLNTLHDKGRDATERQIIAGYSDGLLYRLITRSVLLHGDTFQKLMEEILRRLSRRRIRLGTWLKSVDPKRQRHYELMVAVTSLGHWLPWMRIDPVVQREFLLQLFKLGVPAFQLVASPLFQVISARDLIQRPHVEQALVQTIRESQGNPVFRSWQLWLVNSLKHFQSADIRRELSTYVRPEDQALVAEFNRVDYKQLFRNGLFEAYLYFTDNDAGDWRLAQEYFAKDKGRGAPVYRQEAKAFDRVVLGMRSMGYHIRLHLIDQFSAKDLEVGSQIKFPDASLYAHRGHGGNVVSETFSLNGTPRPMTPGALTLALGCKTMQIMGKFVNLNPAILPIGTLYITTGRLNNQFMYHLINALALGSSRGWSWTEVEAYVHAQMPGNADNFVLPHNISMTLLRMAA